MYLSKIRVLDLQILPDHSVAKNGTISLQRLNSKRAGIIPVIIVAIAGKI